MRAHVLFCLALLVLACGRPTSERRYALRGQVLAVTPARLEVVVRHEEIKGFMDAMTMPFPVRAASQLDGIAPGDLVSATLVVADTSVYLTDIRKIGSAPLPAAAPQPPQPSLLAPGEEVPRTEFVDQDGRRRDFSSFAGSTVVLTFIYTRCPLPNFCPLMDRDFREIQRALAADPGLRGRVHLVTISFDPATNTPTVLKQHATMLGADPNLWTFLTGEREAIDRFGSRFGLSVTRDEDNSIVHNLRTAIVDSKGRLVKVYPGNDWLPGQVLQDLKPLVRAG